MTKNLKKSWRLDVQGETISTLFNRIERIKNQLFVLIISYVDEINKDYVEHFLRTIRRVFHSRERHSLKSVILSGISNMIGEYPVALNITDNLLLPPFSNKETLALFAQHETETGQLFAAEVKEKVIEITANQPGLVNAFADSLVQKNIGKQLITYADYLETEEWYLNFNIDKNVSNVVKIALKHRAFVEHLLFKERKIRFEIDRPAIKVLSTNGLITWDEDKNVKFLVPLYQKKLFKTFYPYTNGEEKKISESMIS